MNGYQCSCFAGYRGERCDLDLDECASSPCLNGASCTNEFNRYSCMCTVGFTGMQSTNINIKITFNINDLKDQGQYKKKQLTREYQQ